MHITKCDICKKTIDRGKMEKIRVERDYWGDRFIYNRFEFCTNCAKPVLKFLKDKKLLKERKNESKK